MSYTEKKITLTITLGEGEFGQDAGNTVTLSGFRCAVELDKSGGDSMGVAQIQVWGLNQEMLNRLTTIGQVNRAFRIQNTVSVAAGDDEAGMSTVFTGTIFDAVAIYDSAPDVVFNILSYAGFDIAVKPVGATSYKGAVDVANVLSDLAAEAGLTLENNGVSVSLSNPYLTGTTLEKIQEICYAADVYYTIDRGILAVWPKTSSRAGSVPKISPQTGMIGYPALSSKGMTVRMLFNPNVTLGCDVEVQSSIPMACGTYRVTKVSHSLSCRMPRGSWITIMDCYNVGQQ